MSATVSKMARGAYIVSCDSCGADMPTDSPDGAHRCAECRRAIVQARTIAEALKAVLASAKDGDGGGPLGTVPDRYMDLREAAKVSGWSADSLRAACLSTRRDLRPLPHTRGPRGKILVRYTELMEWVGSV